MYLPNQIGDANELESQFTHSILDPRRSNLGIIDQKTDSPPLNQHEYLVNSQSKLPPINQHRSTPRFKLKDSSATKTSGIMQPSPQLLQNSMVQEHPVPTFQQLKVLDNLQITQTEDKPSIRVGFADNLQHTDNLHEQSAANDPEIKNDANKPQVHLANNFVDELPSNKEENSASQQDVSKTQQQEEGKSKEEESCRVCLEQEQNEEIGKLIIPCRCTGSMKWIHDECLKTWIVSKNQDIKKAVCELCGTPFNMKFTYKLKLYPKMACEEGMLSLFSCVCLTIIIAGLIAVIAYIGASWHFQTNSSSNENTLSFKLAIMIAAALICGILLALCIVTVREACFVVEVDSWNILKPDLTKPIPRNTDQRNNSENSENGQQRSSRDFRSEQNRRRVTVPQRRAIEGAQRRGTAEEVQRRGNEGFRALAQALSRQMNNESMRIDMSNVDREPENHNNEELVQEPNDEGNNPKDLNDSRMSDVVLIKSPRPKQSQEDGSMVRDLSKKSIKAEEDAKILRESDSVINKKEPITTGPIVQNLQLSLSKLPRQDGPLRSSMGDEWQQSDMNRYIRDLTNRSDAVKVTESMNIDKLKEQVQQPMWIQYEEFVPGKNTNSNQESQAIGVVRSSIPQIERSETPVVHPQNETLTKKAHAVSANDLESQLEGQKPQIGTIKRKKEPLVEKSSPVLLYKQLPKEFISAQGTSEKNKVIEVVVGGQQQRILNSSGKSENNLPKDNIPAPKKNIRKGASQYIIDNGRPSKATKSRSSANV